MVAATSCGVTGLSVTYSPSALVAPTTWPVLIPPPPMQTTPAEAQSGEVAGIYYKDDLIAAPMRFADGAIEVSAEAGMGIAVDEAKVRKYAVGA